MVFKGVALTGTRIAEPVDAAVEAERLGYESGRVTELSGLPSAADRAPGAFTAFTL